VGAAAADDQAFIAKYLDPSVSKLYSSDLTNFVNKVNGFVEDSKLSDADAWAQFQTMDTQLQHQFVQNTFFNELKQAGVDHNDSTSSGFGSYKRGFDAIATYFPNANYDGKLDLAFSQLKTERGGDLNVMAPGGSIVIGLPKIPEILLIDKAKKASNPESILGIFTVKGGNINLFSKGNIDVAQSREFTIAGGNVLNWSSEGDIDAGKGSKTATSAPPPLIRTDSKGNTVIDLSGVVSGSGIGTLQTLASVAPGDVTLIAPSGAVNAGDAGIRSSGNLLVAAQRVIGADNISVGGTASGVPAVGATNISFNAPVSPDSSSTNKQVDQLGAADKLGQNSKLAALPSVISVEVISLGDESSGPTKNCKDEKNKKDCTP
jgi:filamentous hemagglutinin